MNSIGNIGKKNLISLIIPIFFELLLVTIVGNIDTIMLGYYSDEAVEYARKNNFKVHPVCSYVVKKFETGKYDDIKV